MKLLAAFLVICVANISFLTIVSAAPPPIDQKLKQILKNAVASSNSFEDKFDAQVWLLDMSTRLRSIIKNDQERLQVLKFVHLEAHQANLSPELVLAVIHVESYFDRFAISRSGARGLMQIMPFWLKEIGRSDDNLFHIQTNLRFGCTILRYYLDMEKGNLTRALARYNGSLGKTIYPNKVFKTRKKNWYKL
ncbi:MAG: lytic transglycosylase domain-containing protein [Pseudomonadota bacterium]